MSEPPKETPIAVERSPSLWWLPPLFFLLGGLLGAVMTMLVASSAIPTTYTATAWLRIADENPTIFSNVGGGNDDLLKRESAATLIKSNFVISAALRKEGMAQLPCLQNTPDGVTWLKEHIEVSFPGNSEILQIALAGEDPHQLKQIVDAVKDAFMDEVVTADRASCLRRKSALRTVYQRNLEEIKRKTETYKVTEPEKLQDTNFDLEQKKIELERLKKITNQMGDELQRREVELAAEPRVTVLEHATVPKSSDVKKRYRKIRLFSFGGFLGGSFLGLLLGLVLLAVRYLRSKPIASDGTNKPSHP